MKFRDYSKYIFETINNIDEVQIESFVNLLYTAYKEGSTVFVIGNGGSAANASHFAQDLAHGTRLSLLQEKRIRAISLCDNFAFISAISNDNGYETIFEQQLRTYSKPGDILIAISGSGNSPNIIKAVEWANDNGLITVGVTGFNGGKLHTINKYSVHVHLNDMCSSETIHSVIFHYVILQLQDKIKSEHKQY